MLVGLVLTPILSSCWIIILRLFVCSSFWFLNFYILDAMIKFGIYFIYLIKLLLSTNSSSGSKHKNKKVIYAISKVFQILHFPFHVPKQILFNCFASCLNMSIEYFVTFVTFVDFGSSSIITHYGQQYFQPWFTYVLPKMSWIFNEDILEWYFFYQIKV